MGRAMIGRCAGRMEGLDECRFLRPQPRLLDWDSERQRTFQNIDPLGDYFSPRSKSCLRWWRMSNDSPVDSRVSG